MPNQWLYGKKGQQAGYFPAAYVEYIELATVHEESPAVTEAISNDSSHHPSEVATEQGVTYPSHNLINDTDPPEERGYGEIIEDYDPEVS